MYHVKVVACFVYHLFAGIDAIGAHLGLNISDEGIALPSSFLHDNTLCLVIEEDGALLQYWTVWNVFPPVLLGSQVWIHLPF